ncbi:MAG: metallophosphoesterase [candidate division WOR-3 bacterium]
MAPGLRRAPARICTPGLWHLPVLALALITAQGSGLRATPVKTVTILCTNDLHGEFYPTPDWTVPGAPKPELGGLDRLAALVRAERQKGPCLLLDAGDFACGAPEVNQTQGRAMFDLMNRIGYDAVCVGERDLAYVTMQLDTIAQRIQFRLLGERCLAAGANVDFPVVRPSLLRTVGGVKIGLVGLLDERLVASVADTIQFTSGLRLEAILDRELKALKSQDADLILVLLHAPLARGRELAARFPDVSVFFCGHEGLVAEPTRSTSDHPPVFESGKRGQRIGLCRITFDTLKRVATGLRFRVVNLLPGLTEPDSQVAGHLAAIRQPALDDSISGSPLELAPTG